MQLSLINETGDVGDLCEYRADPGLSLIIEQICCHLFGHACFMQEKGKPGQMEAIEG